MLPTITLVLVVMLAMAALEVWLFWQLGERDTCRRMRGRRSGASAS